MLHKLNILPSAILSQFAISKTAIRESVIALLIQHKEALSTKEIEQELNGPVDRVTLYRTIKLFEEKNIIHKIILEDGNVKYRLINDHKGVMHPHFHCINCGKVICLPEIPLPAVDLPEGFSINTQNTIIEGICKKCNND